jgi:stearoyl-CoA desaturase (Delta-9 desaturase)
MGYLVPTTIAGVLWSDWLGGFIYAGILRTFLVSQATFCVNSLAHSIGSQPFSSAFTPRNHLLTALITLGEGYHNFHHEFPSDYRNGLEWHDLDPTKWVIWLCACTGLACDLKRFRYNEIEKGRIQQERKALDSRSQTLDWGIPIAQLPVISWQDYQHRVKAGESLILIDGVVHDGKDFITEHPGGDGLIEAQVGKDASGLFNGGVYNHSNAARNLLATMRVAVVVGGMQTEHDAVEVKLVEVADL